jgi:hypothetical protein
MRIKRCGMALKLIVNAETRTNSEADTKLVTLIAKGQEWLNLLLSGRRNSIKAIADESQVTNSYVTRLIKLALLAPDILESIAKGDQPPEPTSHQLIREVPLADQWHAVPDIRLQGSITRGTAGPHVLSCIRMFTCLANSVRRLICSEKQKPYWKTGRLRKAP